MCYSRRGRPKAKPKPTPRMFVGEVVAMVNSGSGITEACEEIALSNGFSSKALRGAFYRHHNEPYSKRHSHSMLTESEQDFVVIFIQAFDLA